MANKILQNLAEIRQNVPLKDFTTYKIGGPAKYFFIAKTKEDLISAVKYAKESKLPVFILGGGSNLLISDRGFNGLVIKMDICDINLENKKTVIAGGGAGLAKLANMSAAKNLSGLEWAAGIPGASLGGSIYGSAQAFGEKISDLVKEVEALDLKTLKIKKFSGRQCRFSLKNSIFKKNKNLVIICATLEFKNGESSKSKAKIKELINYRNSRHPVNFPSAGSTFVNPEKKITNKKLLEKFPELNEFNKNGAIPAGYLIQKTGIQGKKIGNAQISEKHANFIINLGDAKARDVIALMNLARKKVKEKFGINLETEVQFVGFKPK